MRAGTLVVSSLFALSAFLVEQTWATGPSVASMRVAPAGDAGTGSQDDSIPADDEDVDNVCRAEACVTRGATMVLAMNTSVDPCNDFFQYACGNWIRLHPVPASSSNWSTLKQVGLTLQAALRAVMTDTNTTETSTARQKVKMIYAACMNLGKAPFMETVKNVMGSWPMLDSSWNASSFKVLQIYSKFSRSGQTYFQTITGTGNSDRPRENLLSFDEMTLGLPSKSIYLEVSMAKTRKAYLGLMKNLTTLLAKDLNVPVPADLDKQIQEILDFETSIANISYTPEQRRKPKLTFNLMTLNDFLDKHFNKTFPKKGFVMALRGMTRNASLANAIQLNMSVNVVNPTYHERLDDIWFKRQNGTNNAAGKRFIATYLGWRMLRDEASNLPKRYRDASFEFDKVRSGAKTKSSRRSTGTAFTNGAMPLAVGSMYVDKFFGTDSKAKLLPIIEDIKEAMKTIITEATWMDNETRARALNKLAKITDYMAYPDFLLLDLPRLDRFYEAYSITDVHYLNDKSIKSQKTQKSFEKILQPNPRNVDETTSPAVVNAYYSPSKNMIAMLAGLAQPPIFHKDYPDYLNYAELGFVFGHEITHGFDDQGSLFDEEGRLSTWWTNTSRANFKSRSETIIKQYSAFVTPGGPINGRLTAGENIADNGGLKQAYLAFKKYMSRQNGKPPLLLPGLEQMSLEQVFFLAAAQTWCGYERPEFQKSVILLDVHSPTMFRTNGPLRNRPEFAEAYNCPLGSPMNPAPKS